MQSLKEAHGEYASLLRRLGRCLSFGCNPTQMRLAVKLAPAITSSWPRNTLGKNHFASQRYMPFPRSLENPQTAVGSVATLSSRLLLRHALGEESTFHVKREYTRLQPFNTWKRNLGKGKKVKLKSYSRVVDGAKTIGPLLPRGGRTRHWPKGAEATRLVTETVILTASMTPLALVTIGLKVHCEEVRPRNKLDISRGPRSPTWLAKTATRKLKRLESDLRALELETWDREGAVEDTGGR